MLAELQSLLDLTHVVHTGCQKLERTVRLVVVWNPKTRKAHEKIQTSLSARNIKGIMKF